MQEVARSKFCDWYKHPETRTRPWFEISGPAGSGKTYVVRMIIESLGILIDNVLFMAFVGKAALALRLSGVNGRTIHSTIYRLIHRTKRDEDGFIIYRGGSPVIEMTFEKVESLPDNIQLLVLDEGGMVDSKIGGDILSFGIPLLVLGDLHQLPPVFGKSMFLQHPDVILNEIMRQSKDSQIIYLSQLATHGFAIPYGTYGNDECMVIPKHTLTDDHLRQVDLVICNTNITRDKINWYIREHIYGIRSNTVEVGDKLICRQNCYSILLQDKSLGVDIALANGLIGTVTNTKKNTGKGSNKLAIDFRPEFSTECFKDVPINPTYVLSDYAYRQTVNPRFEPDVTFELGYCSTCHLAQGSQYDSILVYLDHIPGTHSEYFRKWLYTAITRAKKKLIIAY